MGSRWCANAIEKLADPAKHTQVHAPVSVPMLLRLPSDIDSQFQAAVSSAVAMPCSRYERGRASSTVPGSQKNMMQTIMGELSFRARRCACHWEGRLRRMLGMEGSGSKVVDK